MHIKPQDTENPFALMNIIKLAEKDVAEGNVKEADEVFRDIRKRIAAAPTARFLK